MAQIWEPAEFWIGYVEGPCRVDGYVWSGLGLAHHGWGVPARTTVWSLIHLGSGSRIGTLVGNVATVFPVASEVAQCGDFTLFDMPYGWMQTDPELSAKARAVFDAHPEVFPEFDKPMDRAMMDESARAVARARDAT